MAQRRIVWSKEAHDDFLAALCFYTERNGNKTYSKKLAGEVKEAIEKLRKHPFLGRPANNDTVRIMIKGKYQIYYELNQEDIVILVV